MNLSKVLSWALIHVWIVAVCLATGNCPLGAQSLPDVPYDLDFAGVSVHLTEPGRLQVQREIQQIYANRTGLQRDLDALRQLRPLLFPLLKDAKLPDDFCYVALPFTIVDPNAYWAVRREQIKGLGLLVNERVDERYHPIVATQAVLSNLSRLQQMDGNTVQTLLDYLQPDSRSAGSAQVDPVYILLSPQSPPLIWKILARKLVFEQEEPTYRPAVRYVLYSYENGGGQTVRSIARRLNLTEDRFTPFNTWLKGSTVPTDKVYPVLIRVTADEFPGVRSLGESERSPVSSGQVDVGFPVLVKQSVREEGLRASAVFYTINDRRGIQAQACDNAITLAYYGDLSVDNFLAHNDLTEKDIVRPGEIYYLERKAKRAKVPFHVVQKNQTLREVSNMYGVRLRSLMRFNRIEPTQRMQAGRILWLQTKRPRRYPIEYRDPPVQETKPAPNPEPTLTPTDSLAIVADSSLRESEPVRVQNRAGRQAVNKPLTVTDPDLTERSVDVADETSDPLLDESKEPLKLHVVKPGQTYYAIARLYGVSVQQLYAWNNLSEQIPLEVGQELIIDTSQKQSRPRVARTRTVKEKLRLNPAPGPLMNTSFAVAPAPLIRYYVVQPGQTLYRVALINKVQIEDLMRWNNLKNYTIEIGQKLLIRK